MANIRLDLPYEIFDGTQLSFYAPCDSSEVENLIIYYPNNNGIASHVFVFKDAQENNLVNFNNLFAKDACVKVILSITKSAAYIQNANTNKYIEGHIGNKSNPHDVTASQIGLGNVDNTSDTNKPVSTAQATAIADAKKAGTTAQANLENHTGNKSNPHGVTKEQVGLGNVPNVSTNDQMPTFEKASTLTEIEQGVGLSTLFGKVAKAVSELISHLGNKNNPHSVTKAQLGLGNVENKSSATIRGEITSANVTSALGYTPLNTTLKGTNGGLAELDSAGKVPSSQLPSYVDDVLEYSAKSSFPSTGETGKIYVDTSTNKTYRWGGSSYVEISASLALGETSSTAYRGDYGKTAYTHSQKTSGNPHGVTKSDVGLGNVDNTSDANKPVSTAQATAIADAKKAGTTAQSNLETHTGNKSNPHGVTKSQVGLGNVPNVSTNDQTPTYSQASTLATLVSGEKLSVSFGKIMKAITDLISHIGNKSNPHGVTASQVGALKSSDVVDNLLSTSSTLPLSAKMGKQLNEKHKELTQAQYDSLSDSEKKNGTIYLITDAVDNVLKREVTEAQYNALSDAEKKNGIMYFITDVTDEFDAGQIAYDNTASGLSATDVKSAIDEVNNDKAINSPWCNCAKKTTESGTSITITFLKLPTGRTSLLMFGTSNGNPLLVSIAVESGLNSAKSTADWITCTTNSTNKTITISGLVSWGAYFVASPEYWIK